MTPPARPAGPITGIMPDDQWLRHGELVNRCG